MDTDLHFCDDSKYINGICILAVLSYLSAALNPTLLANNHEKLWSVAARDQKKSHRHANGLPLDASTLSCLQTKVNREYPWWGVQMKEDYVITEVKVLGYPMMEDGRK